MGIIKNISKPTVTIAASAFNEEGNIKNFLDSLVKMNQKFYVLKKILIISDGSTDRTNSIIEKYPNKKIRLVKFKDRKGKSVRLNYIYKNMDSDILIQSDCDVIFAGVK